jgi:hypothetical protein
MSKKTAFSFVLLVLAGAAALAGLWAGWQPAFGNTAIPAQSVAPVATPAPLPDGVIGHLPGGSAQALAVSGNHAWVVFGTQLGAVDISDRTAPHELARLELGQTIYQIALYGDYAFLATARGLQMIDISDPSRPRWVGFHALPGDWSGTRIQIRGDYAYVLHGTGLEILDLTSSPTLQQLGWYPLPIGSAIDIDLEGMYVFLSTNDKIFVMDVSDPRNPLPLASISWRGTSGRIAVSQSRLLSIGSACASTCLIYLSVLEIDYSSWTFSYIGDHTETYEEGMDALAHCVEAHRSYGWMGASTGLFVYDFQNIAPGTTWNTPLHHYSIGNVRGVVPTDDHIYAVSGFIYGNYPSEPLGLFILEPPPGPPLSHLWLPVIVQEQATGGR